MPDTRSNATPALTTRRTHPAPISRSVSIPEVGPDTIVRSFRPRRISARTIAIGGF